MERLYTDVFGETHPEKDVNNHHVFARCTAKGKGGNARRFINQEGLVLPILKVVHAELHQRVDFPPVPTSSLMYRISMFTEQLKEDNPYERFIAITEKFEDIANRCPNSDHREQSAKIANNLEQQAEFILLGQVQVEEIA